MGLDAIGALMPDGTHAQLVLLDAEGGFGLGQLNISLPELVLAPIGDIRAQQTGALPLPTPPRPPSCCGERGSGNEDGASSIPR